MLVGFAFKPPFCKLSIVVRTVTCCESGHIVTVIDEVMGSSPVSAHETVSLLAEYTVIMIHYRSVSLREDIWILYTKFILISLKDFLTRGL